MALYESVVDRGVQGEPMMGSTDVGDVSWTVPTVQARVATHAIGTPGHSWQVTAQGKAPAAHKGMVHAAKIMAGTAVDCLRTSSLIEAARADHAAKLAQSPYRCPIPDDVQPPIQPRPAAPHAA
jgi:aminobenzoyl-glutamate utilization protein B